VWFASASTVYGYTKEGALCSVSVPGLVTTSIELDEDEDALFVGTNLGFLYALDVSDFSAPGSETLTCADLKDFQSAKTQLRGLDVGRNQFGNAVLYFTALDGDIGSVEYDYTVKDGFKNETVASSQPETRNLRPFQIQVAPAVAQGEDDPESVFVAGFTFEGAESRPVLQGWNRNLSGYETYSSWGTSVPFVFKPKEDDAAPARLLTPYVELDRFEGWITVVVSAVGGLLYAFRAQIGR
jgi:hypothetical protein